MPSLSALNEFRNSFGSIANERENRLAKDIPYDELPLPEKEAPPFDPQNSVAPEGGGLTDADTLDFNDSEPPTDSDFDFSAFLGSLGVDTTPPPIDDVFQDTSSKAPLNDDFNAEQSETSPQGESSGEDTSETDDIDLDGIDLGGESPDAENTSPADEDAALDENNFNFDNLGGDEPMPLGETLAENDDFNTDADTDGIDLGGESPDFNTSDVDLNIIDSDSLPDSESGSDLESSPEINSADDFEFGDISTDFSAEAPLKDSAPDSQASSEENFGFDNPPSDIDETDFSSIEEANESSSTDVSGNIFNAENSDSDFTLPNFDETDFSPIEEANELQEGDEFSSGNSEFQTEGSMPDFGELGDEFDSDSIDLENKDSEDNIDGKLHGDDFALPGLEEIFDKKTDPLAPPPVPEKRRFFSRKKKAEKEAKEEEAAATSEEIQLTQEQTDHLLKTLKNYPLNLRVACEELIAEHVILPRQLSKLIRLLVSGAPARETALFAGELLNKEIIVPKSFEKSSGEAWEAEKGSFAYIFVHNFIPVLRLFAIITAMAASVAYLGYQFVYKPLKSEGLYKRGYERIFADEYQRADELFHEAFVIHRNKNWFYRYAEGFRDRRRYLLAEQKYEELLRFFPRDKKGVLDFAALETHYLLNYEKANQILQQHLLNYSPNDFEGLAAAGDNFFAWADSDPEKFFDKYEEARFAYARLMELNGWLPPLVERMLKYFIRVDNLKEVLHLRDWFESDSKRGLSPASLAELGGYLLDKQLEEVKGVPNPYIENIGNVRAMLLQAVRDDPNLPEAHYHLARYHHSLQDTHEERLTLENAIRAFDLAQTESVRRRLYRVDTHFRYANLLTDNREFFPAETQLVRGIELFEDFMSRNLISASPQLGKLYAAKGDLDFFTKTDAFRGNIRSAVANYERAERYGWAPPEIQYRMGAAYYTLEDWGNAFERFFAASSEMPLNRKLLFALGNSAYRRGNNFAAQAYFNRLLDLLEDQRNRLTVLMPNDRPEFLELGERLMMARNNAGVVYEALADQTGKSDFRSRALYLYTESARAWDSITRNPETMQRMRLTDMPGAPSVNPGYLNATNAMRPVTNFTPQIFPRIDKDALEPSHWQELAPVSPLASGLEN